MTDRARWEPLASYASGFEADQVRVLLEAEGIPVLLKGPQVGVFGAGFQGATGSGVDLLVPSPELDRARALIGEST